VVIEICVKYPGGPTRIKVTDLIHGIGMAMYFTVCALGHSATLRPLFHMALACISAPTP
jgi:hypothetical protein